jgi:sulfide:quinone oxidoreductase
MHTHDVVIIGGGAAGISTASSLLRRRPKLDIAIVEPAETHYYQPGFTLVGAGVFDRAVTAKPMASVMPPGVKWIKKRAAEFAPEQNEVVLEDGERLSYRMLVAAPGIKLDWDGVEGLRETLGKNGVTSNYNFDTAPYTWKLVQELRSGRAIFTQPAMPIKCAGAPQKAMYLSCDHWFRQGRIKDIQVEFDLVTAALFGVAAYVPALMEYVKKYGITLNFTTRLTKVDGPNKKAWFEVTKDGAKEIVEKSFDMIHVCPPQTAPDFVRKSPLANAAGWIEVSEQTLQHVRYPNIFGLGDACSASNAKTAAAVRKQAPTVAVNLLRVLDGQKPDAAYNGYGSCPLTVERGKIVFAEFGYGGKLLPTFPKWLIEGTRPTWAAWALKKDILPFVYWKLMLKGHEWLARPQIPPAPAQASTAAGAGSKAA